MTKLNSVRFGQYPARRALNLNSEGKISPPPLETPPSGYTIRNAATDPDPSPETARKILNAGSFCPKRKFLYDKCTHFSEKKQIHYGGCQSNDLLEIPVFLEISRTLNLLAHSRHTFRLTQKVFGIIFDRLFLRQRS